MRRRDSLEGFSRTSTSPGQSDRQESPARRLTYSPGPSAVHGSGQPQRMRALLAIGDSGGSAPEGRGPDSLPEAGRDEPGRRRVRGPVRRWRPIGRISGYLRAVGSPLTHDRDLPRGMGRVEFGTRSGQRRRARSGDHSAPWARKAAYSNSRTLSSLCFRTIRAPPDEIPARTAHLGGQSRGGRVLQRGRWPHSSQVARFTGTSREGRATGR